MGKIKADTLVKIGRIKVMTNQNKPIKYDIKQAIGQLSVSGTGWTRELNIIAWNDAAPKLDIGTGAQIIRR